MKPWGIISIAISLMLQTAKTNSSETWRCSANGGINVLYCYLKTQGLACEYRDLIVEQSKALGEAPHNAKSISDIASKHGLPLRAVSLTLTQLFSHPLPVIV